MNQIPKECKNEAICNEHKKSGVFMNKELAISHGREKPYKEFGVTKDQTGILHHGFAALKECLEDEKHIRQTHDINCRPSVPAKTQDTERITVQACSKCAERNGSQSEPLENRQSSKSHFHETKLQDMIAAKALFPEFFPRGPVQDSYDRSPMQPTLEQIYSGRTTDKHKLTTDNKEDSSIHH